MAKSLIKSIRSRLLLGKTARQVIAEGLTYLSVTKMQRLEAALRGLQSDAIPGDFAEFGVAAGGSAVVIAEAAVRAGRVFHGFDVFGMIPEPAADNDDAHSRQRFDVIASGKAEGIGGNPYYGYVEDLYGAVCETLGRYGLPVDQARVRLHKGLFEETLPDCGMGAIAFAHIDCDWYDPVRYCLDFVAKRMAVGGIVLLDDYNDYAGCRRATDEFLAANPGFSLESGRNVILRRNATRAA